MNETNDFAELVFTEETVTDAVMDTHTAKPASTTASVEEVTTVDPCPSKDLDLLDSLVELAETTAGISTTEIQPGTTSVPTGFSETTNIPTETSSFFHTTDSPKMVTISCAYVTFAIFGIPS